MKTDESARMRDALRAYIDDRWPVRDAVSARALLTALMLLQRDAMNELIAREAAGRAPDAPAA